MKIAGMKKIGFTLLVMIATFSSVAQTNIIFGDLFSFDQEPRTNVTMTLSLVSPVNRTWNGTNISNDPRIKTTDSRGHFAFTNVIFGKYRLQPSDDSMTTWTLYVGTNTLGIWNFSSLITNGAAQPPNPGTNYYTQAQIDALLAARYGNGTLTGTNYPVGISASIGTFYVMQTNGWPIYINTNGATGWW